jgi:hypothetical protein
MMPRIKPLLVLCAALLTVTPAASADVNSDMNQFFNKLGFASNTTQPGVWQGQAAGYAYGGSLYARTQVKNVQLISMTLPDINAGCGGIDAYLGSFSFINGEQLQRFVKQIMSNAAGYFFDLALQTTVPEIKSRIRKSIKRFDVNMTFIIFPGYFPYLTVLPVSAGQQSALSLSASEHHCPGFSGYSSGLRRS